MNKMNFISETFAGKSLDMICVNSTQIYIHFGISDYICIYCSYVVIDEHNNRHKQMPPFINSEASNLIDLIVERIFGDEAGFINIMFENGHILVVENDQGLSEPYRIVVNGQEWPMEFSL
jgi:hypothetical protein